MQNGGPCDGWKCVRDGRNGCRRKQECRTQDLCGKGDLSRMGDVCKTGGMCTGTKSAEKKVVRVKRK